jgi:hypothetical protein
MQTIPIVAGAPSQDFRIVLNGISYNMRARWNSRASFWTLDIADEKNNDIVDGIALKAGVDLLDPYNLGIGGFFIYDTTESSIEATLDNIGSDVALVYLTPEELDEDG